MKKLTLLPKTDTVTICLPEDWVGHPIVCVLKVKDTVIYEKEAQESAICYRVNHQKRKKKCLV